MPNSEAVSRYRDVAVAYIKGEIVEAEYRATALALVEELSNTPELLQALVEAFAEVDVALVQPNPQYSSAQKKRL